CGRELRITIPKQELGPQGAVLDLPSQVARLLDYPLRDDAIGAHFWMAFCSEVLAVSLVPLIPLSDIGCPRSVASGIQGFDELFREAGSSRNASSSAATARPLIPLSDIGCPRSVASGIQGFDELFREALSRRVEPERLVECCHRTPGLPTSELVGAKAGQ